MSIISVQLRFVMFEYADVDGLILDGMLDRAVGPVADVTPFLMKIRPIASPVRIPIVADRDFR